MWRIFRLAPYSSLVSLSLPTLKSVPAVCREVEEGERLESTGDVGDRVLVGKWTTINSIHFPPRQEAMNLSLVCR